MEISEVRVKMVDNPAERLQAFCSITLDGDFVIRDLKVIEGASGAFVAMPSRKLADRCQHCGAKNHLRARFCNECGSKLDENRAPKDVQGRAKLHADVAHPINAACRERIQEAVIEAYEKEKEASKSPDYKPKNFDDFDDLEVADEVETVTGNTDEGGNSESTDSDDDRKPRRSRSRRSGRGRDKRNGDRNERSDRRSKRGKPRNEKPRSDEQDIEASKPAKADWSARDEDDLDQAAKDESDEFVSDYNSLIADLKKDAAGRRGDRSRRGGRKPADDRKRKAPAPANRSSRSNHDKSKEELVNKAVPVSAKSDAAKKTEAKTDKDDDPFTSGLL